MFPPGRAEFSVSVRLELSDICGQEGEASPSATRQKVSRSCVSIFSPQLSMKFGGILVEKKGEEVAAIRRKRR